jgi:hypothetical protein
VSGVRVRRHTDGRVAVSLVPSVWLVVTPPGWETNLVANKYVTTEGWSELLVAELPEPDGDAGDQDENVTGPYWYLHGFGRVVAHEDGMEDEHRGYLTDLQWVREDALKTLAAVAACERYRAEAKP